MRASFCKLSIGHRSRLSVSFCKRRDFAYCNGVGQGNAGEVCIHSAGEARTCSAAQHAVLAGKLDAQDLYAIVTAALLRQSDRRCITDGTCYVLVLYRCHTGTFDRDQDRSVSVFPIAINKLVAAIRCSIIRIEFGAHVSQMAIVGDLRARLRSS